MAPRFGPPKYLYLLNKQAADFETQVDKHIINTEKKMLAVTRTAISETIEEAQIPTGKGGRMRVKTGFLRASGIAALGRIPSGPTRGDAARTYVWNGDNINVILAQMKLGDVFYFGWTAHYAKYREAYDGFLEAALQNWQTKVNAVVNKIRGQKL